MSTIDSNKSVGQLGDDDTSLADLESRLLRSLTEISEVLHAVQLKQAADSKRLDAIQAAIDELSRDVYEKFEGRQ